MSNEKTSAFSRTAVLHLLKNNGIYIGFFLIFLLFSFSSPYFFDVNNIKNIVVQSSIIAVIAIGLTLVILTGGIELSVGSVVALTSMISAVLISQFCLPVWVSVLLGILVGGLCGLINGIIISYGKVPAFIATLGMMSFARGLALFSTGGKPIAQLPLTYEAIASSKVLGIPVFIIYCIITYSLAWLYLKRTRGGRYIYAIGGNRDSARLSGINVKFHETMAYVICGFTAGIGGILLTARLNYATPTAGNGFEMDAIAAAVIGGTSLAGGQGNILMTFLGAILIGMLKNGLTLMNVSSYLQQMIIGIVIVLAVFLDKQKQQ
ncbi:MAG: ABC transporter permease [Spirochaetia bacterium]|nr:ABC transporter permease [Spirochaetia bacterium]